MRRPLAAEYGALVRFYPVSWRMLTQQPAMFLPVAHIEAFALDILNPRCIGLADYIEDDERRLACPSELAYDARHTSRLEGLIDRDPTGIGRLMA